MLSQIVTTVGLVFDIIGAGILFVYASPQPSFEEGVPIGLEDANVLADGKTVAQHNEEMRIQKIQYVNISKTALALLVLGFVFQLIGIWIN